MSIEPDTIRRRTLMRFDHERREYRLISNITSQQGGIEIFVEQHVYNTKENKEVWLKVCPELVDKNHMTLEQCAAILKHISEFVNENFYMVP